MSSQKGFTLLELIVVVAIAGIIVTGVVLNSSLIKSNKQLDSFTQKLAKLIRFTHQEAILNNKNYAVSLTKQGYVFLLFEGDSWTQLEQKLLKAKVIPKQFEQSLLIENTLVEPLKKEPFGPHILLLSSGEMSPFDWTFNDLENDVEITITGSINGDVNIAKKEL